MSKTHICHLVYSFDVGGLERLVANTINAMDPNRFTHSIIALTEVRDFINEVTVPVRHFSLHKPAGNDLGTYLRLFKQLRNLKPDVLHSYNLATLEYQWIAMLLAVPVRIHAEHGRDSYDPDGSVKKYQMLRRFCARAVHRVVAVSADLDGWLAGEVGIPRAKVVLIRNGIDTDYYARDSIPAADMTAEGGAATGESEVASCVFGHVARLQQIKNQALLLGAFSHACQQSADFAAQSRLVLVGDGPDRQKLEQLVQQLPLLDSRVQLLGARSGVERFYRTFDVFVMSSLAEGIPMTLLEAMSMSLPPIVTAVGGITEVVQQDQSGLLVPSENVEALAGAMLALQSDPQRRARLSLGARLRVQQGFSQQQMLDGYQRLYLRQPLKPELI